MSSWSGAYGEAQNQAIIAPLRKSLGIRIERKPYNASNTSFSDTDVVELDQERLAAACKSGELVKRGAAANAADDFLFEGLSACGVPTFAWSSLVLVNAEAMQKLAAKRYRPPTDLSALLAIKRFPGKRALIREPRRLLEMMLIAGGTSRSAVYRHLATRQGQDEAFARLDALAPHILWVDGPREGLIALDEGAATMAMTFSGRAFRRLIASQLLPIWDGHIIQFASWAVPASSTNQAIAERFIVAATRAEPLAAQARLWPYGPMRRSALALARRHDLLDADLEPYMSTSDLRVSQGVVFDAGFWADHGAALQQRFDDWLAGVPMGIRVPVPSKAPPPPVPPPPVRLGQ